MKNFKIFLRSFYITAVIMVCFIIAVIGSIKAYESIRQVGFGDNRNAIYFSDGCFHFFDFTIKF